ncbi:hypothetical protein FYK55_05690 [Roseiconus nitratireducens]|uniref:Protein ImuA n=1 Tax=Roseiconus nitratireducens TaxID=2605748 RepID=A0A5M6DFI0_9BACT|nr:hypothetical protein [Roseiconus nitratireducens]KAA5545166.1 hypothetical protein FYK55_05690 [Roseiconus nitratireducens]
MASQQLFSFMNAAAPASGAKTSAPRQTTKASAAKAFAPAVLNASVANAAGNPAASDSTAAVCRPSSQAAIEPNRGEESGRRSPGSERERRDRVLRKLRDQVGCITTIRRTEEAVFSTGSDVMNGWLPAGGLLAATLTEWVAAHESAAAGSLALLAAAERLRQTPARPLLVVDCDGTFYPPAAAALGIAVGRLILVRPPTAGDAIWTIDQALRSGAVAAVWAALPMRVDDRDARRLQLAAETGRTPGLLVRGFEARGKPSFSEVQFYVAEKRRRADASAGADPSSAFRPPRLRTGSDFETISVTLDRVRGGRQGQQVTLQIDDQAVIHPLPSSDTRRHETAARHLAAELANPTTAKRASLARADANRAAPAATG